MKFINRGPFQALCWSLLIGAASLLPVERGVCQGSSDPAVVIAIANIDEQLNDIEYLANAASEQMGQMSGLIKMQAQGFLRGIDTKKPAGVLMYFSEDSPEPATLAFLPIKNLDDFLDTVASFAEVDEVDDTVTIIPDDGSEMTLKKMGEYAFISDQADFLKNAPSDPAGLVEEMAGKYNISARVFPQRIPENLRDMALGMIEQGYEQQLQQLDEIEPMQAELQEQNFEIQIAQMESMFTDTEEVVIGMSADEDSKSIYFDMNMTAKAGSSMAELMEESIAKEPSRFLGFLMEDAAMTANMNATIAQETASQYKSMMSTATDQWLDMADGDENMSDAQVELVTNLIEDLSDIMTKTMEQRRMDMGMVVTMVDDKMNLAMGTALADPDKLEDMVKDVVKEVEKQDVDAVQFNLNSGSHRGTTFHEIIVEVPDNEEEAQNILGDTVTIILGIGKKEVYLAAGSAPESVLKDAMDKSAEASASEDQPQSQMNLYMTPMLKFAAGMPGAEMLEMMADTMEAAGRDRIHIQSNSSNNGFKSRIEIQDGILELLGAAGGMMGGMGGGADF